MDVMIDAARILIVDDSPATREVLQRNLCAEGHEVVSAANVAAAMAILSQGPVDLVINAMQAISGAGTITVRTAVVDGAVVLSVADTGSGMTPEVLHRVFDPFFTTKDVGQGTGLGLAVVQGIVAGHGGSIEVESEPARGSVFRVRLPVHAAASVRIR